LTPSFLLKVLNYLIFYFGWGFSLQGALHDAPYRGPIFVAVVLLYHLVQVRFAKSEILLILIVAILGTACDTAFLNFGLVEYRAGYLSLPWLAPPWVTAIWILLAMCINHSLGWLRIHPLVTAVFGGGGGAVSYYAAYHLGVCFFPLGPILALSVIGVLWFFLLPALFWIADFLKRKEGV